MKKIWGFLHKQGASVVEAHADELLQRLIAQVQAPPSSLSLPLSVNKTLYNKTTIHYLTSSFTLMNLGVYLMVKVDLSLMDLPDTAAEGVPVPVRHKLCKYAINTILEVFKQPSLATDIHVRYVSVCVNARMHAFVAGSWHIAFRHSPALSSLSSIRTSAWWTNDSTLEQLMRLLLTRLLDKRLRYDPRLHATRLSSSFSSHCCLDGGM